VQCLEHKLAERNAQEDEAPRSRDRHIFDLSSDRAAREQADIRTTRLIIPEAPPLLLRGSHSQAVVARIGAGAD
jgi:hypothetical protein